MISFKDALGSHTISEVPILHQQNIQELLKAVNPLLQAAADEGVGIFNTVTSCYRSLEEHYNIYSRKGIARDKVPLKSKHLVGKAIDIYDPELRLTHWIKDSPKGISLSQQLGLYFEDGNLNWVHAQNEAPKSGHRFFKP